ncbi:hypothetical protein [Lysobacter gummosus]|uniref:hypothetical protein n=1 Tax=Lysobacter gummosus TaxID=262324 RepID=UPI00362CCA0C
MIRLARRMSEANNQPVTTVAPAHEIMLANPELGLVEPELAKRYQDLRIMRNKVMDTEDFSPTADAVVEYIHLVKDLVKKFDAIPGRKLPIFSYTGQGQFIPPQRLP